MNLKSLLFLVLTCASVAFPCDDPRLQNAVIGGDEIEATAFRKPGKPLRSAVVRLYLDKKLAWTGATDKNGRFRIEHLNPGKYRLSIAGWGSTEVELKPELSELGNGQRPAYSLLLTDHACVGVTEVVN